MEFIFPYALAPEDVREICDSAGVALVLINTPVPGWKDGERGRAAVPGETTRFREEFARAVDFAERAQAKLIHVMSGTTREPDARETLVDNLRYASANTPPGIQLTIEPINPFDMPVYFLNDFDLALDIIDEVDRPNVRLQFDAYHAHRIEGDIEATWARVKHRVAHIQIADFPGRHEPGSGQLPFTSLFKQLALNGFSGYVSGEYRPQGLTTDGLAWLPRFAGQRE